MTADASGARVPQAQESLRTCVRWTLRDAPGIVATHAEHADPARRPPSLGGSGRSVTQPQGATRPIPLRIRRILQGGFIASSVDRVIYGWRVRGRPHHLNPGGLTGEVIAYLWADDQDEAMIFLASYLAELNLHHPEAGTFGKVGLDELLHGLELCLPPGFDQLEALRTKAQQDVPEHYGSPI